MSDLYLDNATTRLYNMQDHTEKGDDVVIFNHKYAPYFEQWAVQKSYPVVVDDGTVSDETRVDAVCDIKFAITQRKLDDDLLVIAGDNVLVFSLAKFLRYA